MLNINRVFLAGNLTRDVELKTLQSGTVVGNFGLAINNRRSDGQDETVFVDITCWNKTAENCSKFIGKGSNVFIEGRLDMDTWQGQDGKKNTKLKVTALTVQFNSKRTAEDQEREPQQTPQNGGYYGNPGGGYTAPQYDESRRGMYARPQSGGYNNRGGVSGVDPSYGPDGTGNSELPPF